MFSKFRLRGAGDGAAVTWGGYRTAARLATWRVSKVQKTLSVSPAGVPSLGEPVWVLNGTLAGAPDYFVAKQSALLLAIPRPGGFWTWPVLGALRIENNIVIATLGPPMQG